MSQVRIIGGVWRRRWLRFGEAPGLRPTPDRVRETLFNWLGQTLTEKRCLDLFAGSGALGFEAASRGAREVVMVEHNPRVFHGLEENRGRLGASNVELAAADALKYLAQCQRKFDVIFLDPPFQRNVLDQILPLIGTRLAMDGVVYIESERPVAANAAWVLWRSGKAGGVHYHLLKRADGD